jgi:hypothetical protein
MSAALAAVQAIVLLKHRGLILTCPCQARIWVVSMMERNSASSSPGSRPLKRVPVFGTNSSCTEAPDAIGKTHSRRPERPCRPAPAPGQRAHIRRPLHARRGIVAIAPFDAADPAPIDVIRVSRSSLARFDFCPQVGWEQVYFRRQDASNIKKP